MPNCYVVVQTNPVSPLDVAENVRAALGSDATLIGSDVLADPLTSTVYVFVEVPGDLGEAFSNLLQSRNPNTIPRILGYGLLERHPVVPAP